MSIHADPRSFAGPMVQLAERYLGSVDERRRRTIMACAVCGEFATSTFAAMLNAEGPGTLDRLVENHDVTETGTGTFELSEDLRRAGLAAWWPDGRRPLSEPVPDELREFAASLARYHADAGDDLEELRALLLCDRPGAESVVRRIAARLDARLDVTGFHNLIAELSSADRPPIGSGLAAVRRELVAYFGARAQWEAEWHQSARYLTRPTIERVLAGLTDGTGARIVQLHAPGGMGKTTQLRWFIARYCVPEPRRIPCALVDFDVVDPVPAMRYPWLVLLYVAQQLDRQLAGSPFAELLATYDQFLPVLQRNQTGDVSAARPESVDDEEIRLRFDHTLQALPSDRPVVLILDTLEEAVLQPAANPAALIGVLGDLAARTPAVRLVLSGRYDLRERLDGFALGGTAVEHVAVGQFRPQDAQRYLRDIRRISDPELIDAVVDASGCVPFNLALFGDYVTMQPNTTAAEITAFRAHPRLMYVVERILERVPDADVRWVLRYGIVPRHLSFGFLTDVVVPMLEQTVGTGSAVDDPSADERPKRHFDIWPKDTIVPRTDAQLRDLWERLRAFVADSSWVRGVAGDPDRVSFHPNMREPLRQLLWPHPVYRLLHESAAERAEAQAALPGPHRTRHRCNAVYHRFQSVGAAAEEYWRSVIAQAWAEYDYRAVQQIADEVLGPDYLDDGEPRLIAEGRPLVSWSTVGAAYLEKASALVEEGRLERAAPVAGVWNAARAWLRQARRVSNRGVVLAEDRLRYAEACVEVATGGRVGGERALELLAGIRQSATIAQADLELVRGEAEAASGTGQPQGRYEHAARMQNGTPTAFLAATQLAQLHRRNGDLAAAADNIAAAVAMAPTAATRERVLGQQVSIAAESLHAGHAYRRLRDESGRRNARTCLSLASALTEARDPVHAVAMCNEGLQMASGDADLFASLQARRGIAQGLMLEAGTAVADLDAAARAWRDQGSAARAAWCGLLASSLLTHEVGDLTAAEGELFEAERSLEADTVASPEMRVRRLLAVAEFAARRGDPDTARVRMDEAAALVERAPVPRDQISLGVAALTSGTVTDEMIATLEHGLSAIAPGSARLALLRRLRYVSVADPRLDRIADLAGAAGVPPADADVAVWWLVRFDAARVADRIDDALALLASAVHAAHGHRFRSFEALRAWGRLPIEIRHNAPRPSDSDLPTSGPLRGVCAVVIAEHLLHLGHTAVARTRLAEAAADDTAGLGGTQWHARAAELSGRLARGEPERARAAFGAAADTFGRLGDARRRDQAIARIGKVERRAVHAEETLFEIHVRVARADPDRIEIESRPPFGSRRVKTIDPAAIGLRSGPSSRGLRQSIDALLNSPSAWGATVGELIFHDLPNSLRDPIDVRVTVQGFPMFGRLPWELMQAPVDDFPLVRRKDVRSLYRLATGNDAGVSTRVLQRALNALEPPRLLTVDGVHGPATRRRLSEFQRGAQLKDDGFDAAATWRALRNELQARAAAPARVLVLQPPSEVQITRSRGHESSGTDIAREYRAAGAHVEVVAGSTVREIAAQLARLTRFAPQLIHVAAPIRPSGNSVVFDFTGEQSWGGHTGKGHEEFTLPATRFSDLATATGAVIGLSVVLDVPAPYSPAEQLRALLLRNEYAHSLVSLGSALVVLGAGLLSSEDEYLATQMVTQLSGTATPAEVARELQTRHASRADGVVGGAVASLVTAVPPFQLLPAALS